MSLCLSISIICEKLFLLCLLNDQMEEEYLLFLLTLQHEEKSAKVGEMLWLSEVERFQTIPIKNHLKNNETNFKEFLMQFQLWFNYLLNLKGDHPLGLHNQMEVLLNLPQLQTFVILLGKNTLKEASATPLSQSNLVTRYLSLDWWLVLKTQQQLRKQEHLKCLVVVICDINFWEKPRLKSDKRWDNGQNE